MLQNMVLIMSDRQRRNSLGVYGNRYAYMPSPDAFAQGVAVYEHCYCNAPACTPRCAFAYLHKK